MKIKYPDYNNCLVNLTSSILNFYGVNSNHRPLSELDYYLAKDYQNVVLIVYDGLGSNLLQRHLGAKSFLARHKIKDLTSVFPATTTAAYTSIITGKTPTEHCWLGWDIYVEAFDQTISMFLNTVKGTNEQAANYHVPRQEFSNTAIDERIDEAGRAKMYWLGPFEKIRYDRDQIDEMYNKITQLCQTNEKKFIYAYCLEPDHNMHLYGVEDERVVDNMKLLDRKTAALVDQLEDTLIIVTADHGHLTAGEYIYLSDYPELQKMLRRETSLEPRAVNFFVKDEMLAAFKNEFNKLFGRDFILFSKQEVLDRQLFGPGKPHEKFVSCVGDYLAVAITDKCLIEHRSLNQLTGVHAGMTEDEMMVPLIVIEKRREGESDDWIRQI